MTALYISYLSECWDETSDKFSLQRKSAAHLGRESWGHGLEAVGYITFIFRKQRVMNAAAQPPFPFYSVQEPFHGQHNEGKSPHAS